MLLSASIADLPVVPASSLQIPFKSLYADGALPALAFWFKAPIIPSPDVLAQALAAPCSSLNAVLAG
jgi:hypothetical protein